jgi:hypothetical protein
MADNNTPSVRRINRRLDNLNNYMNSLYSSVYSTRVDNKNDLNRIGDDIEDNLDDIISSVNGQNVSDISNLLIRLQRKSGVSSNRVYKELEDLISDQQIIDNISLENVYKYIQSENYQYDLILKYLPKLYQAIELMKDCVLSSDNFTKDFVNIVSNKTNKEAINIFNSKADFVSKKYELQNLFEEMYLDTAIYGEYFLYLVPYKQAYERLMKRQNAPKLYRESVFEPDNFITHHEKIILETAKMTSDDYSADFLKEVKESSGKVELYLDPYGMVPEAIEEYTSALKLKEKVNSNSICESYLTESDGDGDNNFRRGVATLHYEPVTQMPVDGFIDRNGQGSEKIKDMPGAVMFKIPRENIIPLYIGDFCIGYLYFNINNDFITNKVITSGFYNSLTATSDLKEDLHAKETDALVAQIASNIGQQIDAKFINSNTDLKEEIYAILRYNAEFNPLMGKNTVTVSLLPAEDVQHFFFKQDKKTHRGISDLKNSVVPAMMAIMLKLTDTINKVSRSQDKRIYYVKQNVETNVARTMLNVISQLKKGNLGLRQLESMNTIFNVIGKYSDHIIPKSQSGETPIEFEVMQGQNTETPVELINNFEQDAVDATDIPYEWVDSSNQIDFATRFTMSNSKTLRKVFKRQFICQNFYSKVFRKVYNFEYFENETQAEILLPAPAFLTLTNSQQLLDNNKNFVSAIADLMLQDQEDIKPEFINIMIRDYLGTYIDFDKVDKIIEIAKQEVNRKATENADAEAFGGMEDEGDEF